MQTKKEIEEMREMMASEHNICVFGRGSKIDLLRSFLKKGLSGYNVF